MPFSLLFRANQYGAGVSASLVRFIQFTQHGQVTLASPPRVFHLSLSVLRPFSKLSFPLYFYLPGLDVTEGLNNAMSFILSRLTTILLPLFALLLSHNVRAQQAFLPSAIPLAVRSPYLNCWLQSGPEPLFGSTWPTTFNISQVCHPYI